MAERPDPDTDPNTLADDLESHVVYFERHKDDSAFVVTDTTTMLDTMRAAAVGLRQYDAITAAIGDPDELGMYEAYAVADNGAGDELRSMLHRLADTLAAADQGVTDGEAT